MLKLKLNQSIIELNILDDSRNNIWTPFIDLTFDNGLIGTTKEDKLLTLYATPTSSSNQPDVQNAYESRHYDGKNIVLTARKQYQVNLIYKNKYR